MSIVYYANKVKETTINTGTGNLVLAGAPLGFKTFLSTIGADKTFTYYIYRQDNNFEWEIGVGYISSSGGINQLVRQRVVSSTNNNNFVSFTSGTKFIETVLSQNTINTGLLNVEEKSSSFAAPYAPALYVIDSSSGSVTVTLPQVSTQSDPIILSFLLSATSGSVYEQSNAIVLDTYSTETINGSTSSETISILNDYFQLVSIPNQSGWLKIDPIQDSTNPYGNDGFVQLKYDGSFSGVNKFVWDDTNSSLLIGDSGNATADIVLASPVGQTTIFNQKLYDKDFRIAGTGNSHLLFVDGGNNTIGINNSSPDDSLTINANNKNGIHIYKSGIGPSLVLNNTATSGAATNNIIGTINFSGLNTSNAAINYAKIHVEKESSIAGSESSNIKLSLLNNGSFETVGVFNKSGVNLGFNNSNTDGTVIGYSSINEGNNIAIGYYNNAYGENCYLFGDNLLVSSGSYGGAIGSNHSVSGENIWVFGGEQVVVTGNNRTYLSVNNDNYISIIGSGNATFTTLLNSDSKFTIKNNAILSSGVNQSIEFNFVNNSGTEKTGLILRSQINSINSNNENTEFKIYVLNTGVLKDVFDVSANNINLGINNSQNNIVVGNDNNISSTGNSIFGQNIGISGSNNIIFGNNLSASGSNISIFGKDNVCLSSGNLNIVIVGKGNEVNEDYVTTIGIDNANSGLYSFSMGYMNGAHGDYSVAVGEGNLVNAHGSIAIGKNNTLTRTAYDASLLAFGIGNYAEVSNTGFILGSLNEIYGSGSTVFGHKIIASGNDNIVIGSNCSVTGINNIIIGNNRNINNSGTVDIAVNNSNRVTIHSSGCSIVGSNVELSGITPTSGSGAVQSVLYQNNSCKLNSLATSGSFVSPLQLSESSAEYQFLYPTGSSYVYLPNGSNTFIGKKFTIANMSSGININVRKSGDSSDLVIVSGLTNYSIIHGGNNNWIKIGYSVN